MKLLFNYCKMVRVHLISRNNFRPPLWAVMMKMGHLFDGNVYFRSCILNRIHIKHRTTPKQFNLTQQLPTLRYTSVCTVHVPLMILNSFYWKTFRLMCGTYTDSIPHRFPFQFPSGYFCATGPYRVTSQTFTQS